MRMANASRLLVSALALVGAPLALNGAALAQDVVAAAPHDLSVTVYRNPYRDEGGFDLNELGGFAFITEIRRVVLTPGEHRLRFEGVADGIEPASAIVTGLPSGVIEKNRDAALLSPEALVDATQAQGGRVQLVRTDPATGATTRSQGVIRSAAGGVVVETPDGIEALRCSGLPETFVFDSAGSGLSAKPTLSVLTRTTERVEATVQLSYLARGFDWSADYVASMSTTPGKLDLGAWVTLANGNGTGFPNARVQVVAGRLNRESGDIEPISIGQPILAQCWPQETTSDLPPPITIERAFPLGFDPDRFPRPVPAPMAVMARAAEKNDVIVTGARIGDAENLGDLKLYRIPDRTTLASRQSKQVRLLDRAGVPVTKTYEADLDANQNQDLMPMIIRLRTINDSKHNLGLPLPSGRVAVFETVGSGAAARRLLAAETNLRDLAVNEETELDLSESPDAQIRQVLESRTATAKSLPFVRGANGAKRLLDRIARIEITNARPFPIQTEVQVYLDDGQQIVKADHPVAKKDGSPLFRVTVPANSSVEIRYQTTVP
ncbi:MAG: hypothetical protein QM773_04545 [Hyphomonadaceae bacterium]